MQIQPTTGAQGEAAPQLTRSGLWALTITAGVTVASLYYNQPLLDAIARSFHRTAGEAGAIPTLTQAGYATGLLLIVPLGDVLERRRLLLATLVAVAVALGLAAMAPSLGALAALSFAIGLTGVGPQIAVPFAAALTPPERRAKTVGLVMTGLITGILLARTVAGAVGSAYGWRVVFGGAAAAMLVLAASVASFLPRAPSGERVRYVDVLRSIPPLVVRYPLLREAALAGGMAFAAFSAFWTALTFHLSAPPWNYGPGTIGAFGLVGVAGALAASAAGRLADRTGPRRVVGYGLATLAASFVLMFAFRTSLAGLIVGIVLLDLGVQGTHISNQARVYSLPAELHSRLNTVYMVSYFVGGALGSLLGAAAWTHFGWPGVCALGAGMAGVALAVHLIGGRTGER